MDSASRTTPTPAGRCNGGLHPFSFRARGTSRAFQPRRPGEHPHAHTRRTTHDASAVVAAFELARAELLPRVGPERALPDPHVHGVVDARHPDGERCAAATTRPAIGEGVQPRPRLPAQGREETLARRGRSERTHGHAVSLLNRRAVRRHAQATGTGKLRLRRGGGRMRPCPKSDGRVEEKRLRREREDGHGGIRTLVGGSEGHQPGPD